MSPEGIKRLEQMSAATLEKVKNFSRSLPIYATRLTPEQEKHVYSDEKGTLLIEVIYLSGSQINEIEDAISFDEEFEILQSINKSRIGNILAQQK